MGNDGAAAKKTVMTFTLTLMGAVIVILAVDEEWQGVLGWAVALGFAASTAIRDWPRERGEGS